MSYIGEPRCDEGSVSVNPLLDEQQRELREAACEAVLNVVAPLADRIDQEGVTPRELFTELGDAGLLDSGGGADDGLLRVVLVVEQIARKSGAVATVVAGHAVAVDALREDEAAAAGLQDLAAGRTLACLVSGPGITVADERLDGQAALTAGAALADVFVIVARDAEGSAGLYRLEAGAAGLTVDEPEELMGLQGAGIAGLQLDGAPATRFGAAAAASTAGDRLRVAQAAVAVGLARGALDVALEEVGDRVEGGERVDRSQAVQWMLADIATESEAARASTWYAACQTPGAALSEASAMCRLLAAEAAVQSTRRAVQVFGERGALRSSGVERLYRDAKLMEIQGGTNEDQLARIAARLLPDLGGA